MATAKKSTPKKAANKKTATKKAPSKKTPAKKQSAGELSTEKRNSLSKETFAFPEERKEPLNNASHVRNAIARFDQTKGVSDTERTAAFKRIKTAAKKFGVEVPEDNWKDLGKKPHTENPTNK
jgi:hypothetical protein